MSSKNDNSFVSTNRLNQKVLSIPPEIIAALLTYYTGKAKVHRTQPSNNNKSHNSETFSVDAENSSSNSSLSAEDELFGALETTMTNDAAASAAEDSISILSGAVAQELLECLQYDATYTVVLGDENIGELMIFANKVYNDLATSSVKTGEGLLDEIVRQVVNESNIVAAGDKIDQVMGDNSGDASIPGKNNRSSYSEAAEESLKHLVKILASQLVYELSEAWVSI